MHIIFHLTLELLSNTINMLKDWFEQHGLPWTNEMAKDLCDEKGIQCIEDMKLLPQDMFLCLFQSSNFIVREKAKLAFTRLTAESFSFEKANQKTPLKKSKDPIPSHDGVSDGPPAKKAKNTRMMNKNTLGANLTGMGFSKKVTKTVEKKIAEREVRKSNKQALIVLEKDNLTPTSSSKLPSNHTKAKESTSSSLLLPAPKPTFRDGRCQLARGLSSPANKEERKCWQVLRESHSLPVELTIPNLEDPDGLYSLLNCAKETSDKDVVNNFCILKHQFRKVAVTNHLDKVLLSDPKRDEKLEDFSVAKELYEKQKQLSNCSERKKKMALTSIATIMMSRDKVSVPNSPASLIAFIHPK